MFENYYAAIALGLIAPILFAIVSWYTAWLTRSSKTKTSTVLSSEPTEFAVSGMLYLIAYLDCAIVIGIGVSAAVAEGYSTDGRAFVISIAGVLLAVFLLGIRKLRSTRVTLLGTTLEFTYGRRRTVVDLTRARFVYASGGFIVIDEGVIPRVVIPLVFSRSAELLYRITTIVRYHKDKSLR